MHPYFTIMPPYWQITRLCWKISVLCQKVGNIFVVSENISTFAISSGRNRDYNKAFAIISRSAKSVGNLLGIKTQRDNTWRGVVIGILRSLIDTNAQHLGVVHTCKTAEVPFLRYLEAERKRCITLFCVLAWLIVDANLKLSIDYG